MCWLGDRGRALRVFKTKPFSRFASHEEIADEELLDAVRRAARGLIDADLGGGVLKQRIARKGEGKSGGYRTILFFRQEDRAFFVYGFAKNAKDNIRRDELRAFRALAKEMLALDGKGLAAAMRNGTISEITSDG